MDKRLKVQFEFINLYISIAYTEGRTDVESFQNLRLMWYSSLKVVFGATVLWRCSEQQQ